MPDEREHIEPEHRRVLEESGWYVGAAPEHAQREPQIKIERGGRVLFGTPSELAERVQREAEQETRRQRAGMQRAIDSFFRDLQELYDASKAERAAFAQEKELTESDELTPSGHLPLTAHQAVMRATQRSSEAIDRVIRAVKKVDQFDEDELRSGERMARFLDMRRENLTELEARRQQQKERTT